MINFGRQIYAQLLDGYHIKYLYMSRKHRHIKSNTINHGESYAISKPTNATFISTEIMETNEEKDRVRQASKVVHNESKLAEDKETEGQKKT